MDDIDMDGIPNQFDLDSDGDGCKDVIEAGLTDPDNGILGTGTSVGNAGTDVKVDPNNGKVIKNQDNSNVAGYNTPQDLDSNNKKDFLEKEVKFKLILNLLTKLCLNLMMLFYLLQDLL